jgi:phage-related minor tail protein
MATIKGLTIEIGGETTGLSKALNDVNKISRNLSKELGQIERQLKFDPKNTTLLAQKQKVLGEQIATTRDKLVKLKDAEKQVQEQFKRGEVSEEQYRALQREIVATESKLGNYTRKLKDVNAQLDTFEQKTQIVSQKLQDAGKKISEAGQKLEGVGKNLTTSVTLPLVGAGAAAFKFGADLQDAMGASDQIFKGAAGEVKTWADSLESYYGIAEGEALEYANTMGAMLQNIGGLSEAEAAKQSQTLVQLAGDLAAMFGGTTESAVQALTGALKGNTSMLDNYGMGVNEATIKAKALEMGLYDGKGAMDLQTKQAATLALIMEQTADAQGQAAREAEGGSGSMRALTTELKNLASEIGEVLLPIITPFITKLKEIIQKFSELSPETKETIVKIGLLVAAIGPLLLIMGTLAGSIGNIISLGGTLVKNWDKIKTVGGVLSGGLKASVGFIFSPAGAIMLGIAAVIAIGVALYKNWDTIKAKAGQLGSYIRSKFNQIKTSITTPINSAISSIKSWIGSGVSWMVSKFNGFRTTVSGIFNRVKSAITGPISSAISTIKSWLGNLRLPEIKIPKIKLPHLKITGGFSITPPRVPKFSVKWYDKGGIFKNPAIIGVGEKRPEFVGALDDLRYIVRDELNKSRPAVVTAGGPEVHLHIGTLVADDMGLKKLENTLRKFRISEDQRRGDS